MGHQDHSDPEKKAAPPVDERRRFPRHECRLEAQVWAADSSVRLKGKVSDLSIGGCFVEMLSPLPVDTEAELAFTIGTATLHVCGKVRVSQPGFGMGIEFTQMGSRGRENLRRLTSAVECGPESGNARKPPWPEEQEKSTLATASALEAVVRVLLRKGIVTKEELADEVEKSKDK